MGANLGQMLRRARHTGQNLVSEAKPGQGAVLESEQEAFVWGTRIHKNDSWANKSKIKVSKGLNDLCFGVRHRK